MEIVDYNVLVQVSKEITLKALDKNLIQVDPDNNKKTAKNIADFFNEISDALSELSEPESPK